MFTLSAPARTGFKNKLILVALVVLAFLPTWTGLAHIWSHTFGYAHGWLIALISLWLLLSSETPLYPAKRSFTALGLLAAGLLLWAFARFSFTDIAEQMMLPVLSVLIAYSLFGLTGARSVAFASFYILFAVPIWDITIPWLQKATVFGVTHALTLIGIPNAAKGNFIAIPFGSFHVERGCSGANFVIVAIAIGLLNAKTWALPLRKSIFAVAFITVLSILANWVRVFVIVLRAWQTDMQTTLIRNHYWFGWYLFAGALVLYFIVARLLDEGAKPKPLESIDPAASRKETSTQLALTVFLLTFSLVYTQLQLSALSGLAVKIPRAPASSSAWTAAPYAPSAAWQPRFPGAKAHALEAYRDANNRTLFYYRAFYTEEHEGSKLIGWGVSPVPANWRVERTQYLKLNKTVGYTGTVRTVLAREVLDRKGELWLIWSWYALGAAHYAHPLAMKLAQGAALFLPGRPSAAEANVLAVPCYSDCTKAKHGLTEFIAHNLRD